MRISFGGPRPPTGPSGSDERLLAGLASPFVLDLGEPPPAALWILVPGFVPYLYVDPPARLRDELWVELERESGIEVRLTGAAPPESARLRLYTSAFGGAPIGPAPREERPARSPVFFGGLAPGAWCASLEAAPSSQGAYVVLASASVELARGAWTTIALDSRDVDSALEPALLTLRFPASWIAEPGARARLVPGAGNPDRLDKERTLAIDGPVWGPVGLVPGTWTLVLDPGHVELPLELEPGERRELEVPQVALCDAALTILDADGEPAQIELIGWRAALAWDGSPAPPGWGSMKPVPPGTPLRLRAPAVSLELTLHLRSGELRQAVVDLRSACAALVVLPARTTLRIELAGLEDVLDLEWLARVRVHADGLPITHAGLQLFDSAESSFACIELEASGTLDVEFPPLRSQGSLRARRVDAVAGDTLRIALGPDDLLGASSARK